MTQAPHSLLSFLQQIPRGRVVSYGYLARRFGIHPRTVAFILASNAEQDIYPCYRVVHTDCRIGGYNLGTEEKIRRLTADGIVVEKGRVDGKYLWEK